MLETVQPKNTNISLGSKLLGSSENPLSYTKNHDVAYQPSSAAPKEKLNVYGKWKRLRSEFRSQRENLRFTTIVIVIGSKTGGMKYLKY